MIAHRITDDGVLVTLKQSWGTACATLTESQLKRFAWGVLADLDPDGMEKLAEGTGFRVTSAPSKKKDNTRPRIRPQGSISYSEQCDAALISMFKAGGKSVRQIGEAMKPPRTRGSVAGRIDRLRRRGLL